MKAIKDFKKGQLFLQWLGTYHYVLPGVIINHVNTDVGIRSYLECLNDSFIVCPKYISGLTSVFEFRDLKNIVKKEFYEKD